MYVKHMGVHDLFTVITISMGGAGMHRVKYPWIQLSYRAACSFEIDSANMDIKWLEERFSEQVVFYLTPHIFSNVTEKIKSLFQPIENVTQELNNQIQTTSHRNHWIFITKAYGFGIWGRHIVIFWELWFCRNMTAVTGTISICRVLP